MTSSREWIEGYFDETLTADQYAALDAWIAAAPENAREFARAARLHDAIRNSRQAAVGWDETAAVVEPSAISPARRSRLRAIVFAALASGAVLALVLAWPGVADRSADASVAELRRVLAANRSAVDRTYHLTVDETGRPARRGAEASPRGRPPKPPLDDARLYVSRGERWVLVRRTSDGLPFITGSDGRSSWAVRPDGPVRTSSDPGRFNRDVPGHENSLPLASIHDGFERLTQAYEIHVLPVEPADEESESLDSGDGTSAEPTRLLVAVKKRGERGPRRVEISYAERSGLIRELRFVDMPYGPDRLTLRMTLVDDSPLDENFFRHEAHHEADRPVEVE